MRRWIPVAAALAAMLVLVLLAFLATPAMIRGLQLGFVFAGAGPIGAVLMLAIARLTGAEWSLLERLVPAVVALVPVGALAMLAGGGVPVPEHLAIWQAPWFAALRAVLATAALAFAGWRLAAGASQTFAGVTLAFYAWLVTPIASAWLLGTAPGHSVSAAGMMLFVQQIGSACALLLLAGWGPARLREDMAKLLVAASLGLCYLVFMDYLIIWFGNLPSRVPFYLERGTAGQSLLVTLALLAGLAGPVAALSLLRGERGQRIAAASALGGYCLFDLWWIGGSWMGAIVGLLATVLTALAMLVAVRLGGRAHG